MFGIFVISIVHVIATHAEFIAHVDEGLLITLQSGDSPFCANEQGCDVLWL
jgi:hypothetical protein